MAEITKEKVIGFYKLAKLKTFEKKNVLKEIKAFGSQKSSAEMYITGISKMLSGEAFTMNMSQERIKEILNYIYSDYGLKGLSKALESLKLHIPIYMKKEKSSAKGLKQILADYKDILVEYKKNENIDKCYPDEIKEGGEIFEGAKKQVTVNSYERSSKARKECIENYGHKCIICGFDFEENYGEIGIFFIHVHHLKPLSEIDKEYKVDPIEDLRPVCPNCHAMLHQKKPAYTIKELKEKLK